jgi:hypothetical protein
MSRAPRAPLALALLAAALPALAACEDFATPSDLDRPQIIAIIAEPPMIAPGEASALTVVMAGPAGILPTPEVRWTVLGLPGEPPRGEVVVDEAGARYVAPPTVAEQPTIAPLEARVEIEGRTLLASKLVGIGSLALRNPTVTALEVAGAAVADGEPARVARGSVVAIAARAEPAPGDDAAWSWYSTAGEIERFRSNPAELAVGDEVGPAWLIAVLRDGTGGQAVGAVPLVVD